MKISSLTLLEKLHPKTDKDVHFSYDSKKTLNKQKNKERYLKEKDVFSCFTLLISTENLSTKEKKILPELLHALSHIDGIQPIILGNGMKNEKQYDVILEEKIGYSLSIADAILFFPSQLEESLTFLVLALRYGTVPIVSNMKKLEGIISSFNPVEEKGNGFFYEKNDIWNIFESIIRARENHRFPYDWENLIEACMKS